MKGLEDIFSDIVGKDKQSIEIVKEILKKKMKPEGSLGILEELVQKMGLLKKRCLLVLWNILD